jgi:hypothetical protein
MHIFNKKVPVHLIIGIIAGSLAGYFYYREIGCSSGTCPLTSNPWISTGTGAVMGFLLLDIFTKRGHDSSKPA